MVLNIFLAIAVASLEALIEESDENDGNGMTSNHQLIPSTEHKVPSNDIELGDLAGTDPRPPTDSAVLGPLGQTLAAFKGEISPAPVDKTVPDHNALYILSPTNCLRTKINSIIWIPAFDNFILACILISSLLLALEDPVNPDSRRNDILTYFDYVFTSIFTLEMLMKILALGLVLHKRAYMRSAWNLLDMVVVTGSLLSIALASTGTDVSAIKVLRVLRVMRPLRAINRAQKLKEVSAFYDLRESHWISRWCNV